nr:hypothetical protein C5F59_20045 [Streptomyces sp. QL37]
MGKEPAQRAIRLSTAVSHCGQPSHASREAVDGLPAGSCGVRLATKRAFGDGMLHRVRRLTERHDGGGAGADGSRCPTRR